MRILFFAQLKDATGCSETRLAAPAPFTTETLWTALLELFPSLASHRPYVRLARNGEFAGTDTLFGNDDEVALLPPVSGG